jgi:hypothetical protein
LAVGHHQVGFSAYRAFHDIWLLANFTAAAELPAAATPAMQEGLAEKSPSTSNGPCAIATNPQAIHTMTKIGFT